MAERSAEVLSALWGKSESRPGAPGRNGHAAALPAGVQPGDALVDIQPPGASPAARFPLDALPMTVAEYVTHLAWSMGVEPEVAVLPALASLGAAIGNTRRLLLKTGWTESAMLWPIVVARPGSLKTPVLMAAAQPLRDYERILDRQNEQARAAWDQELAAWERQKSNRGADRGPRPEEPTARRQVVYDSTVEELIHVLRDNPRGLLLLQDEISSWVRGMNQYKAAGRGGDRAKWLSFWSGVEVTLDRRAEHGRPVRVWDPFVAVTGGIQPDLLRELRPEQGQDDGFMDRLLFGWPPEQQRLWTEATVPEATQRAYERLFRELLTLDLIHEHPSGRLAPRVLRLGDDARAAWIDRYNGHHQRMAAADFDPRLHGAFAKLDGYAARIALVIHLARAADGDGGDELVDRESVEAAWQIADYFKAGAERVYSELSLTAADRHVEAAVEWMRKHHTHEVTARDCTTYRIAGARTLADVRGLFFALAERGYGASVEEAGGHGGRKRLVFRMSRLEWQEEPIAK